MIKFHTYKLISEGLCSYCNRPTLVKGNNDGYRCKQCGRVFLIDRRKKYVLEPDRQCSERD